MRRLQRRTLWANAGNPKSIFWRRTTTLQKWCGRRIAPKTARLFGLAPETQAMREHWRHGAGFVASGVIAFATDALTLVLLTHAAGFDPFSARLIAIATAMIAGFFSHRNLTFGVAHRATWAEFTKFIAVAATASLINYAVYSAILLVFRNLEPLVALVAASAIAMIVSYFGYRFGVFRKPNL